MNSATAKEPQMTAKLTTLLAAAVLGATAASAASASVSPSAFRYSEPTGIRWSAAPTVFKSVDPAAVRYSAAGRIIRMNPSCRFCKR
jgi:hypothetical protein